MTELGGNGYLTIPEAAKIMRVSKTWLYKKAKAGVVPHFRVGGIIRFTKKDIDEWMNAHKCKGALKV